MRRILTAMHVIGCESFKGGLRADVAACADYSWGSPMD